MLAPSLGLGEPGRRPDVASAQPDDLADGDFIDEVAAARLLGKSPTTLRSWRVRRANIPFYRIGGAIRYKRTDVLAFRESGRVEPILLAQ
jgi:hypothetical protein